MLLICVCGTMNRIPSLPKKRIRCGKCGHIFTPAELVQAKREAPPSPPQMSDDFDLESELDVLEDEEDPE